MGEVDLVILNKIYRKCIDLEKEHNWNFHFEEDTGKYETMIEFLEDVEDLYKLHPYHPPLAKDWDQMDQCNAPDILAFNDRIIIEYEEESKPQKGPKIRKKGHWAESKKDAARDIRYKHAGFRVCKIWESELKKGPWELKLFKFLADCYTGRNTNLYRGLFLTEKELKKAIIQRKN